MKNNIQDSIKVNNNFSDRLQAGGILSQGYGIIPKLVMMDNNLSITAKGLYAYLCSYTGAGSVAFPSRDKILRDLGIGKDAYNTARKQLIDKYISVSQSKHNGVFGNNTYTLLSELSIEPEEPDEAAVSVQGILGQGFGFISKMVMTDSTLALKSKALYAFYCSLVGTSNFYYPDKKKTLYFLSISEKTFLKSQKELVEKGYIKVEGLKVRGQYAGSKVTIMQYVDAYELKEFTYEYISISEKPYSKNPLSAESTNIAVLEGTEKGNNNLPHSKNPSTKNPHTKKPSMRNPDTKSNILNNNIIKNNIKNKESEEFCYEGSVGSIKITQKQYDALSAKFENIEKLLEKTVLSNAQRKNPPRNMYARILEIALDSKWPERVGEKSTLADANEQKIAQWKNEAELGFPPPDEAKEILSEQEYEELVALAEKNM